MVCQRAVAAAQPGAAGFTRCGVRLTKRNQQGPGSCRSGELAVQAVALTCLAPERATSTVAPEVRQVAYAILAPGELREHCAADLAGKSLVLAPQ